MKSYNSKQIIDFLLKNGFIFRKAKGSHQIFYNPATEKRAIVPFHNKDLPIGTLLSILKQAGFTKEDLKDFY